GGAATAGYCEAYAAPTRTGTVTAPALTELSGIAASRANPGVLYVHNDSGDTARFFAIDQAGALLAEFDLPGVTAVDWEDIAVGPCGAGGGSCVYLGDIGDNNLTRSDYAVYRVREPSVSAGQPLAAPVDVAFE